MATIKVIDSEGIENSISAETGGSLMNAILAEGIDGIEAECGGAMACATCHVYVDPDWVAQLPTRTSSEEDMLECAASEFLDNSRLSCQIEISDALDGLVVRLPETQY